MGTEGVGEAAGRGVGGREARDEVLGLREAARPGGSQAGTPHSEGGAEVRWALGTCSVPGWVTLGGTRCLEVEGKVVSHVAGV